LLAFVGLVFGFAWTVTGGKVLSLIGFSILALSVAQFFHPKLWIALLCLIVLGGVWEYFSPGWSGGWH
jgi:hypothetical protein